MTSTSSTLSPTAVDGALSRARALVVGTTGRMSGAAFGLLTSILVTLLASSSAPTPLYATYQARWG